MTNMAFFGNIVSFLLGIVLIHQAKCEAFVTVKCLKSEMVVQYGTNTVLDCVVQTQKHITNTKIDLVTWSLNGTSEFVFKDRKYKKQEKGFQFAANHRDDTNMNVSLLITNTNFSHVGQYKCSVGTDNGFAEAEVHLTVKANYSKPSIYSTPEKIRKEKNFSLTCEANGGFPKGKLRWVVDNHRWKGEAEEKLREEDTGLLDLSSKLTFKSDTPFKTFVCEVYNANGVKEGEETLNNPVKTLTLTGGGKPEGLSLTQIVAPVLVIGSLIVGLLLLLLFRRRRQRRARRPSAAPLMSDLRDVPPDDFDGEAGEHEVVVLKIDNNA